jgi:hypothetical protein
MTLSFSKVLRIAADPASATDAQLAEARRQLRAANHLHVTESDRVTAQINHRDLETRNTHRDATAVDSRITTIASRPSVRQGSPPPFRPSSSE